MKGSKGIECNKGKLGFWVFCSEREKSGEWREREEKGEERMGLMICGEEVEVGGEL